MAGPRYDESRWPVVVVRLPPGALAEGEDEAHLAHVSSYFARCEPFALVMCPHARGSTLTFAQRRRIGERTRLDSLTRGPFLRGIAVVVRSQIERGLAGAVLWLMRPPYPVRFFADLDEAVRWADAAVRAPQPAAAVGRDE
jgi:hypothetical protein